MWSETTLHGVGGERMSCNLHPQDRLAEERKRVDTPYCLFARLELTDSEMIFKMRLTRFRHLKALILPSSYTNGKGGANWVKTDDD